MARRATSRVVLIAACCAAVVVCVSLPCASHIDVTANDTVYTLDDCRLAGGAFIQWMPSRNASIYIRRSTVQHLFTDAYWWDTIAITIEDSTLSTSSGTVDANGCHDSNCIGAWGALSIVSNVALTIRRCLFLPQVQASALPLCHYGIFAFSISQLLENSVFLIEDCNLTFGMLVNGSPLNFAGDVLRFALGSESFVTNLTVAVRNSSLRIPRLMNDLAPGSDPYCFILHMILRGDTRFSHVNLSFDGVEIFQRSRITGDNGIVKIGVDTDTVVMSNVTFTFRSSSYTLVTVSSSPTTVFDGYLLLLMSEVPRPTVHDGFVITVADSVVNISSTAVSAWVCSLAVNLRRLSVAVSNVTSLLEVVGPSQSQEMARSTAAVYFRTCSVAGSNITVDLSRLSFVVAVGSAGATAGNASVTSVGASFLQGKQVTASQWSVTNSFMSLRSSSDGVVPKGALYLFVTATCVRIDDVAPASSIADVSIQVVNVSLSVPVVLLDRSLVVSPFFVAAGSVSLVHLSAGLVARVSVNVASCDIAVGHLDNMLATLSVVTFSHFGAPLTVQECVLMLDSLYLQSASPVLVAIVSFGPSNSQITATFTRVTAARGSLWTAGSAAITCDQSCDIYRSCFKMEDVSIVSAGSDSSATLLRASTLRDTVVFCKSCLIGGAGTQANSSGRSLVSSFAPTPFNMTGSQIGLAACTVSNVASILPLGYGAATELPSIVPVVFFGGSVVWGAVALDGTIHSNEPTDAANFARDGDMSGAAPLLDACVPAVSLPPQTPVLAQPPPAKRSAASLSVMITQGAFVAGALLAVAVGGASVAPVYTQASRLSLRFGDCQFTNDSTPSLADSPTQMQIGDDASGYDRGTVIGNMTLFAAAAMWFVGAALVVSMRATTPTKDASSAFALWAVNLTRYSQLPGSLVAAYALLSQPALTAGLSLIAWGFAWYDIVLGLLGCGAVLIPLLWWCKLCLWRFPCEATPTAPAGAAFGLARWLRPQVRWRCASELGKGEGAAAFLLRWGPVFEPYTVRRHWFSIVELATPVVCGVIGTLRPDSNAGCRGAQGALLAVSVLLVAAAVLLVPFNTRDDAVVFFCANAMTIAASICVLVDWRGGTLGIVSAQCVLTTAWMIAHWLIERWLEHTTTGSNLAHNERGLAFSSRRERVVVATPQRRTDITFCTDRLGCRIVSAQQQRSFGKSQSETLANLVALACSNAKGIQAVPSF